MKPASCHRIAVTYCSFFLGLALAACGTSPTGMTKASPREAAVATPVQSESLFNKGFHARNPSEQDVLDFVDAQDAITGVRSNPEASGYPGGFRFKRIENIQIVQRTSARPLNVALTRVFSAFVDANYAILNPREYVKNLVPREMPDTPVLATSRMVVPEMAARKPSSFSDVPTS